MAAYQAFKPLPAGLGQAFPPRASSHVALLSDVTWVDASGQRHSEQAVFDEALRLIGRARRVVVLDMFLFNDFAGQDGAPPLRRSPRVQVLTEARIRDALLDAIDWPALATS